MCHKAEWIGYKMKLKLTLAGLLTIPLPEVPLKFNAVVLGLVCMQLSESL